MIILQNAGREFNKKWAVRGLNLLVEKGEIFGLLGPNGAGKTTTIKMMTGLLRPTEGRILIGDFDIVQDPLKAKALFGYVPDKAFLYEKLRGREFLMFIASLYRLQKSSAMEKIEKLAGIFGIAGIENDLIESYSQGMRQRLLFISALLHDPRVLIIDEPFVGLDTFGVRMIKDFIKKISAEGTAIFLATHSLYIAEELCDRVGMISNGTLVSVKSRKEIERAGGLEALFLEINSPA